MPCKKKVYLNNITEKKSITILRQILKLYDYNVKSVEKYIKGDKLIEYNIYSKNKNKEFDKNKCIISFD